MVAIATEVTSPSFEDFHRARSRDALRYAMAIVGPDSAEDACQEAWLRAWRAWGSADAAKVDAWLRSIVRNCCRDRLGAERVVSTLSEDELPPVLAAEDIVVAAFDEAALLALLRLLPDALQETLWLREMHEMSYTEIADRQGIPLGTVMSRLHAARARVRQAFRPVDALESAVA